MTAIPKNPQGSQLKPTNFQGMLEAQNVKDADKVVENIKNEMNKGTNKPNNLPVDENALVDIEVIADNNEELETALRNLDKLSDGDGKISGKELNAYYDENGKIVDYKNFDAHKEVANGEKTTAEILGVKDVTNDGMQAINVLTSAGINLKGFEIHKQDDENKETYFSKTNDDGSVDYYKAITMDGKTQIIHTNMNNGTGTTEIFDANRIKSSSTEENDDDTTTETYTYTNGVTETITYDKDGNITYKSNSDKFGNVASETEYTDERANITTYGAENNKTETVKDEDGKIQSSTLYLDNTKIEYTFNENGFEVRTYEKDENGEYQQTKLTEYQKNDEGNYELKSTSDSTTNANETEKPIEANSQEEAKEDSIVDEENQKALDAMFAGDGGGLIINEEQKNALKYLADNPDKISELAAQYGNEEFLNKMKDYGYNDLANTIKGIINNDNYFQNNNDFDAESTYSKLESATTSAWFGTDEETVSAIISNLSAEQLQELMEVGEISLTELVKKEFSGYSEQLLLNMLKNKGIK